MGSSIAHQQVIGTKKLEVSVRPLQEDDLPAADRVMRLAFGTFLGLPEPTTFMGDAGYIRSRWLSDPAAAFGAQVGGDIVGSIFASNWGSVGFFGPLTVRPDLWDQGLGKRLMQPVMECFERWGTKHAGLFTFAQSQKHVGLYQHFGFWPRFLTAIMSKQVERSGGESHWSRLSGIPEREREGVLRAGRELTDAIYQGLDVTSEIRAVASQNLGDTVLVWGDGGLAGLAVCHCGPHTEAGSGHCYVKFGAVRPGPKAKRDFAALLQACEGMAAEGGLSHLTAGVNAARHQAYSQMLERGYRTEFQGVAMQRPNEPGYNRPGTYLIDDWR
jgi:GNAT superfamily N-acetyltransferase